VAMAASLSQGGRSGDGMAPTSAKGIVVLGHHPAHGLADGGAQSPGVAGPNWRSSLVPLLQGRQPQLRQTVADKNRLASLRIGSAMWRPFRGLFKELARFFNVALRLFQFMQRSDDFRVKA
jgi:hypothetical protein